MPARRPAGGLLVAALLLAPHAGCERAGSPAQRAPAPPPQTVVILSLDTVRADHLGCYGYFRDTTPSLDALARESTLFEQCLTPMAVTLPAHLSLFTGLYPLEHGVTANALASGGAARLGARVRMLAEVMSEAGYDTAGFVSATPLKPESGIDAGFRKYDAPIGSERRAADTTDAALAWLGERVPGPLLLFVHYFDAHHEYAAPPPYATAFRTDDALENWLAERGVPRETQWSPCSFGGDTRTHHNGYDGELRYLDEHVGRLLAALRASRTWDDTLVVVVGDHGEGLNQHHWTEHGQVWIEQARVPLLIRFPRTTSADARRVAMPLSLVDVTATALSRFGADWIAALLSQSTGRDALASDVRPRPVLTQRTTRACGRSAGAEYSWTDGSWRLHFDRGGRRPRLDLFDLARDPFELVDLSDAQSDLAAALRAEAEAFIAARLARAEELSRTASEPEQRLSPEFLRELSELGYVGEIADEDATETQPASRASDAKETP